VEHLGHPRPQDTPTVPSPITGLGIYKGISYVQDTRETNTAGRILFGKL